MSSIRRTVTAPCVAQIIDHNTSTNETLRQLYNSFAVIRHSSYTFPAIAKCLDQICRYMVKRVRQTFWNLFRPRIRQQTQLLTHRTQVTRRRRKITRNLLNMSMSGANCKRKFQYLVRRRSGRIPQAISHLRELQVCLIMR